MLVKGSYTKFPLIYWILVIPTFLVISYKTLFLDIQIQNYYFNELEDFGRYVFFLGLSFVEAFVYILIIREIIRFLQLILKKSLPNQNNVSK
ncbi:MAG: hypothetical protein KBT36_08795 [Kurthia sp.]|nr:hypothetical protein [Candidatus Kurthia equi]